MQQILPSTSCLPCLIERMIKYNNDIPYDIMLFDVRIIFLITALNISTRQVVKTELNGDECLITILENIKIRSEQKNTIEVIFIVKKRVNI